jgi:hypothetical protein
MVKQASYAQELEEFIKHQDVSVNSSLKHCIHSLIRQVISEWEDDYTSLHSLIKQRMGLFCHEIISLQI